MHFIFTFTDRKDKTITMSTTKIFFILATILIFAFEFLGIFLEVRKLPDKANRTRSDCHWLIALFITLGITVIGFIVFYNTIWKLLI